jgi:hypothetical protein
MTADNKNVMYGYLIQCDVQGTTTPPTNEATKNNLLPQASSEHFHVVATAC